MISEHQIQCQLIAWWQWRAWPDERPLLFAIPNGGARNAITGAMLKREGVRAGVPDLFLAIAKGDKHGLFVELKTEKGKATPAQKEMVHALREQGFAAEIAKGYDNAVNVIKQYMGWR